MLPCCSSAPLPRPPTPSRRPRHADPVTPTQCGPADSGSTCDGSGPASQGNSSGTDQGAGNPINVITGNKYQQEADLPALPGVLGLEIVRHYNSSLSGARTPPGTLGRGWKLSYETDLYPIGNTLQIVQADGTRIVFVRDPKNPSQCASHDPARGRLAISKTPRGEEYVWTWTNGRTLSFNSQGKLVQIKAPTGEFVSLTRDTAGALVKVTDPQGRSLVLGYPARRSAERFNGVTHIDSPVGRFAYAYGSAAPQGAPANPRDLLANLVRVDLPNQVSRHYHYEDPAHPTLLTGISIAGERVAGPGSQPQRINTWAYDTQGRGILSVKGEPKRLGQDSKPIPGTGIEQVTLDFGTPGKTVLTNSLGQTTTYTHAIVGNEHRLLEVAGAGCANCGEANIRYGYDKLGRLAEVTKLGPSGQPLATTRTERDALGRITRVSRVAYRNAQAQPARPQVRYAYQGDSDRPSLIARPSVIPGKEAVTRIAYNAYGQPARVTESGFSPLDDNGQAAATPISRTTAYAYRSINGRSLLAQIDGPLPNGKTNSPADSDITRLEWDGRGDYPVSIIKPGNLASRVETRDEAGRPTAVREVNGVLTTLQLAPAGQTTRIERAGRVVSITYDARMQPISLSGNDGQTIRIAYLPEAGKLRYTLPDGQTREETYNSERQITSTGWLDGQGRRLSEPGRLEYHPQTGQLAGVTLPSGLHTTFGYDAQGQLSHWQRGKAGGSRRFDPQARLLEADIAGAKYQMRADEHEASLALTLPTGAVHAERIDDFGRVVQQTSPERGTRTARYDAAGRTLEVRDAVRVMVAYYDPAGRILERCHRNLTDRQERQVRYTWQGIQLVRIDDAEQITEYAYDGTARGISERVSLKPHEKGQAASVYLTRYRYDALGRLDQIILPEGATLTPHYDAISRITRDYQPPAHAWWVKAIRWVWADYGTQPLISDLATDSAHGVLGYTHANGERVKTHHDRALRLTQRQDGAAATRLAYNADDEIASVTRNSQALELAYDRRGRLQQVIQEGTRRQEFTLDTNGNRLEQATGNIRPYAYRPQSDQLLAEADRRYTYNAAGEPVQIEGDANRRLAYDPLGQVAQVEDDGREIARYRYNQNRQRIAKTANGQTTFFLWQGGAIAAEANAQGKIKTRYVYMGSRPVAMIQYDDGKARLYAIHTDHLGTPLQVTDADRKIVWQAEYDIYGRASVRHHSQHSGASPPGGLIGTAHASAAASFDFNLRLPGQYEDAETGWHYNFHRYYNPETGRYLTPDPIGLEGGTNLYAYVDGNPAGAGDPWGLYRLVMGFEVNHPAAFAGGVHNLNIDYGHTFFYLVDNDNKISSVFSFGPAVSVAEKGDVVWGVEGSLDYGISETSKLFSIDINTLQYFSIKSDVSKYRFFPKEKYWTALNNTCAESAVDVLGKWYLGLGLPSGKSPIKVPDDFSAITDEYGVTNKGISNISLTNPYALFNQMIAAGFTYHTHTTPLGKTETGTVDPNGYKGVD